MELARRVPHERARPDGDGLVRRAHRAATLKAEVNLGRLRMAVVGADLARLPAGNRDVAFLDLTEDLLNVLLRVPGLLLAQIEHLHGVTSVAANLEHGPL